MTIFNDTIDATDQAPAEFAKGSRTGFIENVRAGFDETMTLGLGVSRARRRAIAYDDVVRQVNAARGDQAEFRNPYHAEAWGYRSLDKGLAYGGIPQSQADEQRLWAEIARQRKRNPGFMPGFPASRAELEAKIENEDRATLERTGDIADRSGVWGSVGNFIGAVGAGFRDPVNILSIPLGAGPAKSILGAALREGTINAAIDLGQQPAIAENYRALGIDYGIDDAAFSVGANFAGGAILGGGAKFLERPAKSVLDEFRAKVKDPTPEQKAAADVLEQYVEIDAANPKHSTPLSDAQHFQTLDGYVAALETDMPPPATRADPIELKTPTAASIDRYDPRALGVDASRFQFKDGGDAAGVTDRLAGVKEWSPVLSGKSVVWVDNEGKAFVADGHQRVGLAKRLLEENPDADIKIDAVTLKESDGITAEMARTWAALKNIAEGTGSAVDAAKVLRTTGDNTPLPLPPRSALVRDARALGDLSDEAFGMVVNDIVPPEFAALVGRLARGNPDMHAAYLQLLHRLAPANMTQAESIIRQAIAAGGTRETQLGLFGEEVVARSLYLERARVLDNSLRRLKNDRKIFRTLIDAQDDIEAAGNVLAGEANVAKVENNAQALEILSRLAHRTGPVSDALGRAAQELAAGRSAKSAVDRFVAELEQLDLSELARGMERGSGDGSIPGGGGRAGGAVGEDGGIRPQSTDPEAGDDLGVDLFGEPVRPDPEPEAGPNPILGASAEDAANQLSLEGFTDPHAGRAVVRQAELLEHDVRMLAAQDQPFGPVHAELADDWAGAVERLKADRNGEVPGALSHVDVGPIDVVWGKAGTGASDGYGLAKVVAFHPEVVDDLPSIIASMQVRSRSENRIRLESQTHEAAIRLDWDKQAKTWLLTAYEKREEPSLASVDDRGAIERPGQSPGREGGVSISERAIDDNMPVDRQLMDLRAASPLRSIEEQADVDGLALFDQARSPDLFAVADEVTADGVAPQLRTAEDLLAELDADDAAIKAIEGCLI